MAAKDVNAKGGQSRKRQTGSKHRVRSQSPGKASRGAKKVKANKSNEALRLFLWGSIVAGFFAAIYGASTIAGLAAWKLALFVGAGSITMPLTTILWANAYVLATSTPSPKDALAFATLLSVSLSLVLMINAKYAPLPIVRVLVGIAIQTSNLYHWILDFAPSPVMRYLGTAYTIVSELLLVPAVIFLLLGVAQLRYAGEDFNRHDRERSPRSRRRILIVFIHGNKFNEAQWLFGRLLLLARPWSDKVDFISINIFKGFMMRNHSPETITIPGCAQRAVDEIQNQIRLKRLEPDHILLMGHSLGGVLSAYIKEHYSSKRDFPVERVVSWSAPLGGSHLLLWGKKALPGMVHWLTRNGDNITLDFCPTNPVTVDLRNRMRKTDALSPTYFTVTGWCDPLVRPRSAIPSFLYDGSKREFPYLGHYNIKVSLNAWKTVISFVDDYMQELQVAH